MKSRYSAQQIYLHWIVFILVVLAYLSIELRVLFEKGLSFRTYMVLSHFSFGFLVWIFMIIRLLLFIKNPIPNHTSSFKIATILARTVHMLLYIFFIALPTIALIAKYMKGIEWYILGISMPTAKTPNQDLYKLLIGWHKTISVLGYWLVGGHALVALIHHYILKDNTLVRMLLLKKHKI